jgi:hypothetical protein
VGLEAYKFRYFGACPLLLASELLEMLLEDLKGVRSLRKNLGRKVVRVGETWNAPDLWGRHRQPWEN